MTDKKKTGLELLREPFPANQISKLPKPTTAQTDAVKRDFKAGIRCKLCGAWHHPDAIHLDYVGHAALTDRLLDCDPNWNWEPVTMDLENGRPKFDPLGGMWIKLTVCNATRLGYGHAGDKKGGDAIKEVIGDALRNAAMRFGAALDLWHKGELHVEDDDGNRAAENKPDSQADRVGASNAKQPLDITADLEKIKTITDVDELDAYYKAVRETTPELVKIPDFIDACKAQKALIVATSKGDTYNATI